MPTIKVSDHPEVKRIPIDYEPKNVPPPPEPEQEEK
jgi:hypothetical protein